MESLLSRSWVTVKETSGSWNTSTVMLLIWWQRGLLSGCWVGSQVWIFWTKGWFMYCLGWSYKVCKFIMLLKLSHNLQLYDVFISGISHLIFWTEIDPVTKSTEIRATDGGGFYYVWSSLIISSSCTVFLVPVVFSTDFVKDFCSSNYNCYQSHGILIKSIYIDSDG